MKLNFKELWQPYSEDGCSIQQMINWAQRQANPPKEVMDQAVQNLFMELGVGREFPTEGCDCGCEMTNAHSAINHYFLREVIRLKAVMDQKYWKALESMQNVRIEKYVKARLKQKELPWSHKVFADWLVELFNNNKKNNEKNNNRSS